MPRNLPMKLPAAKSWSMRFRRSVQPYTWYKLSCIANGICFLINAMKEVLAAEYERAEYEEAA